jgi:hypothetical protein
MRRNEVGILTVARCLSEGVGTGVKAFVDTASGLQEINNFTGHPGTFQVVLVPYRRYGAIQIDVRLDTEVFLARYDLAGMAREDVLQLAGRAASVHALGKVRKNLYGAGVATPDTGTSLACTGASAPKMVDDAEVLASNWQG